MSDTTRNILSKNVIARFMCAAFVLIVMCHENAAAAEVESVALVTDLTGKAVVLDKSGKHAVSILFRIDPNTKVRLDDNARMVVLYVRSNQEYEIQGPSTVRFKTIQPESIEGSKPSKRNILFGAESKSVRIDLVTVAQAAMVMRGSEPALMLETHPEFHWKPAQPYPEYQFVLNDETGDVLLQTVVKGDSYKLASTVNLDDKRMYAWRITALPQNKESYSVSGSFRIASAELRRMVESMRPRETAPPSEYVAFAIWLEQMKLKDEARKYWRMAAAKRPEAPQLADMAAN